MKELSLVSSVEALPFYEVEFTVTAHGTTAAYITETGFSAGEVSEKYISDEDTGALMTSMVALPKVIPPDARINQSKLWAVDADEDIKRIIEEVKQDRLFVYARGFIKYKDVFDREREMRFRYVWKYFKGLPSLEGMRPGEWKKCGSPDDNKET